MYRILSSTRNDIETCPLLRKYKFFSNIVINQQVLFIDHLLSHGNIPLLLKYILSLFRGRENTFASLSNQILEAWLWLVRNRKQRLRHEAYKFSHPTARKFKFSVTLHFKIDGLSIHSLQNLNFLLFSPRKANKAKRKDESSKQNCKVLERGLFSSGKHAMLIGKQAQRKIGAEILTDLYKFWSFVNPRELSLLTVRPLLVNTSPICNQLTSFYPHRVIMRGASKSRQKSALNCYKRLLEREVLSIFSVVLSN